MDFLISSSLAYALGSLAVGAGLTIANNEDLYNLCYIYFDYMGNLAEDAWDGYESWEEYNEQWDNNIKPSKNKDGKQVFLIPFDFLEPIKNFFKDKFSIDDTEVSARTFSEYSIPYSYSCMTAIEIGMTPLIVPSKKTYFKLEMEQADGNAYISYTFYEHGTENIICEVNDVELSTITYGTTSAISKTTHFVGWQYLVNELGYTILKLYTLDNTETLKDVHITIANPEIDIVDNVISFPTNPNFDWDTNVDDNVDDDGNLEVPLIPPEVWIGDDVTPDEVWTPNPENVPEAGDILTFPEVDDAPIDIPNDITIPEENPVPDIDIPTDTPIDTPTTPDIPPIVPVLPETPDVPDLDEGEDGEIDEDITDNWGNSNSGGLYYYYIGTDVADSGIDDVIGHATGVVSLSYTPYLWYNDCNITKIPYDSERFGKPSTFSNFYVYRINNVTRPVKKVGGFTAYGDSFSVDIGAGRPYSYKNETKLYQYPYSFAYVYDGINQPMEVKYHYLSHVFNEIYIKQTVSDKCTYGIFIRDYKGDAEGNLESVVLTSGNELPCSSSTYAQWFATNRNQINQNVQNVLATNAIQSHGAKQQFEINKDMNTMNMIGGLGTALAGLFTMNLGGVGSGLSTVFNTNNMLKSQQATLNTQLALNKQSDQNAIQSAMALNNDMRNAPPTLISHGSNVFYGILNTDRKLLLIRMGLSEVDLYRLGTYFTMYGYKQNKVMDINLRSRKYFNYFKITAPNIVSYSVPHSQLDAIKEIFKNGVTLWHYNNSDKVLNYFHSDNYEV